MRWVRTCLVAAVHASWVAWALAAPSHAAGRETAPASPASSVSPAGAGDYFPDWSTVTPGFYPLSPAAVAQPVIGPEDVTDANAYFVADPFLVHDSSTWYLFFEVTTPVGRIALATSPDGLQWTYQHIVLSETFQLSYPHVFRWQGTYYMTPESAARQSVRLYRATSFPDSWQFVTELVKGRPYADPSVFRHDDRWWMFVGNGSSDSCFVFYSDSLESGWSPHPMSPIVAGNRGRARPGGRAIVLSGDRLHRLAQNSTPTYGRALRVFQVDVLTTTSFAEHEIPESPIVQASGSGWNADGMHHCDPWWTGDRWLAAVDGHAAGAWRIGIYTTPAITSTDEQAMSGARLLAAPNPFRSVTILRFEASPATAVATQLAIYDAAGRRIVRRALPESIARSGVFAWDGLDAQGRPAPAGVYLCRLQAGSRAATTRLVRVQ